jgi:fibronectin-binding autotransporter adhesin
MQDKMGESTVNNSLNAKNQNAPSIFRSLIPAGGLIVAFVAALAGPMAARAQTIVLTASDSLGNSSFNSAGNWSPSEAPAPGGTNSTVGYLLRGPASGSAYTFLGDQLTVGGGSGAAAGGTAFLSSSGTVTSDNNSLIFKTSGQTLTVNRLILDGAQIRDGLGDGSTWVLSGNLYVTTNGGAFIAQALGTISSSISGPGPIFIGDQGNVSDTARGIFFAGTNTYSGNIIMGETTALRSRFTLSPSGNLNFVIGANGVNNSITVSNQYAEFAGTFNFNLAGADNTLGDVWTIVVTTAGGSSIFDSTFTVGGGFALQLGGTGPGQWYLNTNGVYYEFNTATGILAVVPPPPPPPLSVVWNGGGADNNWSTSLNWTNSFGPSLTLTNNTLFAGATRSTPNMNGNYTVNNLTFDVTATNFTIGTTSSTLTLIGAVNNNSTNNTQTLNVPITLGTGATLSATVGNLSLGQAINNGGYLLTVGGASNTILNAAVSGSGGLTMAGPGVLTLPVANSFSGGVTLSGGQLNINNATALGAAAGTFTIAGGTIDNTSGSDITVGDNYLQTWNGNFTYAGSIGNLNLGTGTVTPSGNIQVTVTSNTLTVAGVIGGSGSLSKAGAGTLVLLGTNTFSGNMSIANGTLATTSIGSDDAVGGVGAGLQINFGSLPSNTGKLLYTGTGESTYKVISLSSSGGSGIIDQSGTGTLDFEADWIANGATNHPFTLQGSTAGVGEIDGAILDNNSGTSSNHPTSIIKAGTGVWILTGLTDASLYTGDTTIQNGTLIAWSIGSPGIPGALGEGTNINFGSGGTTGTLVYTNDDGEVSTKNINLGDSGTGGGVIVQSSASGLLQFSTVTATGANSHTLTLEGSNTGSGAFVGRIADNSPVNQTSLTKAGTGLWTLSGTNTYTGPTLINSGTLAIAGGGAISNSATISVGSGAWLDVSGEPGAAMTVVTNQTLAGSGTVIGGGTITIANGATLSPGGATPGTLAIAGSLVLNNSSTLAYALGTSSDRTTVSAKLTLAGTIDVVNSGGLASGNYVIFNYGSVVNNGLATVMPAGFTATVSNDTLNSRILLVVSAVAANPFVTWQDHYFTPTELANPAYSGPNADPLGKGMSNTNQFLAGFNPTNAAAYLHIISVVKTNNNTDINVTYLGANGDSSYTGGPAIRTNVLEFTTGTGNGSYTNNFASTGQTNVLNGGTGSGVVTNMVDSGGATNKPSRFYRVRVLLP